MKYKKVIFIGSIKKIIYAIERSRRLKNWYGPVDITISTSMGLGIGIVSISFGSIITADRNRIKHKIKEISGCWGVFEL